MSRARLGQQPEPRALCRDRVITGELKQLACAQQMLQPPPGCRLWCLDGFFM